MDNRETTYHLAVFVCGAEGHPGGGCGARFRVRNAEVDAVLEMDGWDVADEVAGLRAMLDRGAVTGWLCGSCLGEPARDMVLPEVAR
jgi:hypothetical protein